VISVKYTGLVSFDLSMYPFMCLMVQITTLFINNYSKRDIESRGEEIRGSLFIVSGKYTADSICLETMHV